MVPPGIEEVVVAQHLGAGLSRPLEDGRTIVDDEADVPVPIGGLGAAGGQRDELVADVDERHLSASPA